MVGRRETCSGSACGVKIEAGLGLAIIHVARRSGLRWFQAQTRWIGECMRDLRGSPNTNTPVGWKKSEDISRIPRGTASTPVLYSYSVWKE